MRIALVVIGGLLLGACATRPRSAAPHATQREAAPACAPPSLRDTPPGWCALPNDVRAFVEDRDTCDHFRGEPWPESDSDADRARRREILEAIRTNCAGTDARLAELRRRYAAMPDVLDLLASYEAQVEGGK